MHHVPRYHISLPFLQVIWAGANCLAQCGLRPHWNVLKVIVSEALMGKSWHLSVNKPLYSEEHLPRDQGLSLIWASSLKCMGWVRLMSLGTRLQKHWA